MNLKYITRRSFILLMLCSSVNNYTFKKALLISIVFVHVSKCQAFQVPILSCLKCDVCSHVGQWKGYGCMKSIIALMSNFIILDPHWTWHIYIYTCAGLSSRLQKDHCSISLFCYKCIYYKYQSVCCINADKLVWKKNLAATDPRLREGIYTYIYIYNGHINGASVSSLINSSSIIKLISRTTGMTGHIYMHTEIYYQCCDCLVLFSCIQ